jgi:hypothetical protein
MVPSMTPPVPNHTILSEVAVDIVTTFQPQKQRRQQVSSVSPPVQRAPLSPSTIADAPA